MEIQNIDIRAYYSSSLKRNGPFPFMQESKTVPMLSVVQPLAGQYTVAVDNGAPQDTGNRGVFVVPRNRTQHLCHILDENDAFVSHWVFLDVVINHLYSFEELFDISLILPEKYNDTVCELLSGIRRSNLPFGNYARIHSLLEILTLCSTPKEPNIGELAVSIRDYISRHYPEHLTPEMLAERFNLSMPTLYRFFSQNFNMSPCNYINDYRLQRAALLLEHGRDPIKEIGIAVGFSDEFYFSKLFKKRYNFSPKAYREALTSASDPAEDGSVPSGTSSEIFRNCSKPDQDPSSPFASDAYGGQSELPSDFVRCIDRQEPDGIIRPD